MKIFIPSVAIAGVLGTSAALSQTSAPSPAVIRLDQVVVTASPLQRTLLHRAQAVSGLAGDRLRLALEPTLGETLAGTPGVSSTYFGPAASRSIIRGLDSDRIRVLQNASNTV